MIGHFGIHGSDYGYVVDMLSRLVEQFANFSSRLAVLAKSKRRRQSRAGLAFGGQVVRNRPSSKSRQRGFGVERVNVRRAAVQKEVDDWLSAENAQQAAGQLQPDLRFAADSSNPAHQLPKQIAAAEFDGTWRLGRGESFSLAICHSSLSDQIQSTNINSLVQIST